jgi:hypothetical protein
LSKIEILKNRVLKFAIADVGTAQNAKQVKTEKQKRASETHEGEKATECSNGSANRMDFERILPCPLANGRKV